MNNKNNILSYFIKDIKDPIEIALYEQRNRNDSITIVYKNYPIFMLIGNYILKHIRNIHKTRDNNIKCNYKIHSYMSEKYLYYKHDKKISTSNSNYIIFSYIRKKYQVKTYFEYFINNIRLFITLIKYFNGYKYKYIIKKYMTIKYTNNIIIIMNKYELHYYNKFFDLYFGYKYALFEI
jgi:hypothetical protein